MILYRHSFEHDVLLEAWYHHLRESGDLTKVFTPPAHALGRFMGVFQPPTECVFDVDDHNRIVRIMWFGAIMQGALAGLWLAPKVRHQRASLAFVVRALRAALSGTPVVLGITKQPDLLEPHRKLGYTISEAIPGLWFGETAWLVMLTKEKLEASVAVTLLERRKAEVG